MNYATPVLKMLHENICLNSNKGPLESTHEIITRLKFISMVKRDEKINVKSMYIQPKNMFTSISRLFNQESRDTTLNFLTMTFNRVFEIITHYTYTQKPIDKISIMSIINDLMLSINGLTNLQHTYSDDRLFVCHIQTLIEMINSKIREVKEYKPDLFSDEQILRNFTDFNNINNINSMSNLNSINHEIHDINSL
jgi:hypothetical protein